MKKLIFFFVITGIMVSCNDWPGHGNGGGSPVYHTKKFSAEVAVTWFNLQQDLIKTTSGFDPLVASRAFAYSGLALYESVVKGMPGYNSVAAPIMSADLVSFHRHKLLYWPASANAAMASILKNLYANTSEANKNRIDSLEAAFNATFQQETTSKTFHESVAFGKKVATEIFEWSKTDGGHEAYLSNTSPDYVPPTGPGMWIPTSPTATKPIRPYWGNNRSFIPNSATMTLPGPPLPYSEVPGSPFYNAVNNVYTVSQNLTEEQIAIAKTWGDIPGNYGTPAHYTNIATQLIQKNGLKLDRAVLTYVKHGIGLNEAMISVFKAKYTYTLIRPISYIYNVMGQTTWNTVIGTPPHPEYPSAHATLGGASYTILESIFGKNHSFVDHTHENIFGARSYPNIKAYAEEASWSRVLAGIHYEFSAQVGLNQGAEVGKLVNQIPFK